MAMITKAMLLLKLDNMIKHYEAAARKTGDINLVYVLQEIQHLAESLPDDVS